MPVNPLPQCPPDPREQAPVWSQNSSRCPGLRASRTLGSFRAKRRPKQKWTPLTPEYFTTNDNPTPTQLEAFAPVQETGRCHIPTPKLYFTAPIADVIQELVWSPQDPFRGSFLTPRLR